MSGASIDAPTESSPRLETSETRLRRLETLIRTIALSRTVSAKWVCPLRRLDRACYVGFTFGESKPRAEEAPRVWCIAVAALFSEHQVHGDSHVLCVSVFGSASGLNVEGEHCARGGDAAEAISVGWLVNSSKALSKMSGVPR